MSNNNDLKKLLENEIGNGLARLYGLTNGIDMARFNQFKMTGRF